MNTLPRSLKFICSRAAKATAAATLIFAVLCGCTSDKAGSESASSAASSQASSAAAAPATLEQELLQKRGIDINSSNYKKALGAEGIIDIKAEFDCLLDRGYSTGIDAFIVSHGKLYRANFNQALANGQNVQEIAALPDASDVVTWRLTYDGEMGSMYFKSGAGYKVSATPYSASPLDSGTYPMFKKVYRYSSDGKTLEDHTAEYLSADKVYNFGEPQIVFAANKVSLLFSAQYLDKGTTDWNWYRDKGWREYIAFDLDTSAIGSETPLRLFNRNILMTDRAFYEIVYAAEPLDDKNAQAQLAPDGTTSPYYPAAELKNCPLKLRKIDLLTRYYGDVLNICTSHVITKDYKLLPISEVLADGYGKYEKYSCDTFYRDYERQ